MPYRFCRISLLTLSLLGANLWACTDPKPETELEDIYCQIKAKGKGSSLPDFQSFRRNPPSTQALLLKRPAAKLGLSMPSTKTNTRSTHASKPVIQSQAPAAPRRAVQRQSEERVSQPKASTPAFSLQQACVLDMDIIRCGSSTYELQLNQHNKNLPSGALSAANRLELPQRSRHSELDDRDYLSLAYPLYIEKMVTLGLADATMSFTKFVATYEDISSKGVNFSDRFTQMYELLKKEKQSNAVRARYNNKLPQSLTECMSLNPRFIVCDNVTQNWIYMAR